MDGTREYHNPTQVVPNQEVLKDREVWVGIRLAAHIEAINILYTSYQKEELLKIYVNLFYYIECVP